MENFLKRDFENILNENQIPFMQIEQKKFNSLHIKVYFPRIIKNICKFFDKKFEIKNKNQIVLEKDKDDYYKTNLTLIYKKEEINITIFSMLKYTWGIS